MLWIKIKNFLWNNRMTICLALSLFLCTTDVFAAPTFDSLNKAGTVIANGLKEIIWPAATIGIASVCIAGMFGNFNWKWFIAILLGVLVVSSVTGVDFDSRSYSDISGND